MNKNLRQKIVFNILRHLCTTLIFIFTLTLHTTPSLIVFMQIICNWIKRAVKPFNLYSKVTKNSFILFLKYFAFMNLFRHISDSLWTFSCPINAIHRCRAFSDLCISIQTQVLWLMFYFACRWRVCHQTFCRCRRTCCWLIFRCPSSRILESGWKTDQKLEELSKSFSCSFSLIEFCKFEQIFLISCTTRKSVKVF